MAAWLPVAKAILPYLGDILTVAKPVFTKRKGSNETSQIEILQQQVAELQNASLQNIQDIKALAEQLKTAVPALERTLVATERRLRLANRIAWLSLAVALVALGFAMALFLR
ncbi:hypothetical protein [Glaciimonas sp. PCH181]|uniref:hypothetical protein n=1 Tax=Glaciimonas sp. PCH181 TaxID=2133943 RepID=UPI000D39583E|nr:hypothetical protein [Glaciimonas sp. PCH181]PUA18521.1 hypothetical protein C7W93_00735 [Glaciimonas sp. PCH181]